MSANATEISLRNDCESLLKKTACHLNLNFLNEISLVELEELYTKLDKLNREEKLKDLDEQAFLKLSGIKVPLYFYHTSLRDSCLFIPDESLLFPVKDLGKGGFGSVRHFFSEKGKPSYAVKSALINDSHFKNEKKIFDVVHEKKKSLFFDTPEKEGKRLVTPFIDGVTLFDIKNTLSKNQLIEISLNTVIALQYIHQKNLVHNDIRAKNIMVKSDSQVEIIDFGESIDDMPELQYIDVHMYCDLFFKLYLKEYRTNKDSQLVSLLKTLKKGLNDGAQVSLGTIVSEIKKLKGANELALDDFDSPSITIHD